jgi:predicted MFS family arabinose efflux permease
VIGVVGPLTGGLLMQRLGPSINFGLGAALMMASAIPLLMMRDFDAGPVPSARQSMALVDRKAIMVFAADGWMESGLQLAWPMVLFVVLGSQYETFGLANAAAGLAGAGGAWLCGRAIDGGGRDRYLAMVSLALAAGFALRIAAGWSPIAATIANATGAAVMGVYIPVLMSHIYDSAKTSGAAYRFHFAAEAGWDFGAATGCLVAALVVVLTGAPSLALVPGTLGIVVLYAFVRRQPTIARPSAEALERASHSGQLRAARDDGRA